MMREVRMTRPTCRWDRALAERGGDGGGCFVSGGVGMVGGEAACSGTSGLGCAPLSGMSSVVGASWGEALRRVFQFTLM